MGTKNKVYLYDSTLRDGSQARGVDFTLSDKQAIAKALSEFGIDYIEGGWPGANPTDDAFFATLPKTPKKTQITAFGMTRRAGRSADNDPGLQDVLAPGTSAVCLVGKAWAKQVKNALKISQEENLRMVRESIAHVKTQGREALFDAEHFFDGYKDNPKYALEVAKAAYESGARWVVLCDTNGGSLPSEISDIVTHVIEAGIPGAHLGIHCHNDTEQAVANSLAAVNAGVRQVQGCINGIGERCGNANLISIIPTLTLKMGMTTGVSEKKLTQLKRLSRLIDERLNRDPNTHAPYVGEAAFAHKGGLHVSAMAKDSTSYEHIDPSLVGNERQILVSDKAGKSNIITRLKQLGLEAEAENPKLGNLVKEIKEREQQGYAYEDADASFELLVKRRLGTVPLFFHLDNFRVTDERRWNAKGELVTMSEATVKLRLGDIMAGHSAMLPTRGGAAEQGAKRRSDAWGGDNRATPPTESASASSTWTREKGTAVPFSRAPSPQGGSNDASLIMEVAEGNGPVNALDAALRKALVPHYATLKHMKLVDYKVRILNPQDATAAITRVMVESEHAKTGARWTTIGVSQNVIDASFNALHDAITYMLVG